MRVLIVDDDHIICRCLQTEIDWKKIGCEPPMIAYNGIDAMKIMETDHPDIVISDVRMPVMDGTALCRLIHEKYPNVVVRKGGYSVFFAELSEKAREEFIEHAKKEDGIGA